jgi:hypothetical protein
MKKIALLLIVSLLLAPMAFAAPSDEEIEIAFSGVFAAYGALFLTSMMGQAVPGVTMNMDMEAGESSMVLENVDVETLFTAIGEAMDGSGEMPEITFTHLSGTISSASEGEMNMDVTLEGGPVKHLEMQVKNEELLLMKADGRDCTYLSTSMDF